MNILVTGGAGYVGSHCLRALLDRGHRVVVTDDLSNGHRTAVDSRAQFIQTGVANIARISSVIEVHEVEAVMHFAGFLEVGESVKEPLKYYENNVSTSCLLLQAMQRAGIRRMVFSSTAAVYGSPPTCPITEDMPLNPINPYGRTKLAVEWAMRDCAKAWGLGGIALRYFNAAGAARDGTIGEDHDPETHLIPIVLQVAQGKREQVAVFGTDYPTPDGTCIRDYIHVEDLADAHVRAIEACEPGWFRAFNVGTGTGTSVLQIIEAARKVTDHAIPVVLSERREGDPAELLADPTQLMQELEWKPRHTDIHKIVDSAWCWHRNHPQGFSGKRPILSETGPS